jgi:hypothetical protein
MTFKRFDEVSWKRDDGQEVPVTFEKYVTDGVQNIACIIRFNSGEVEQVDLENVLPPKKQGFAVRDYAWIVDESKAAKRGEIIALGYSSNQRRFYLLRFENSETYFDEWHTEDEVFNFAPTKEEKSASGKRMANFYSEMNR